MLAYCIDAKNVFNYWIQFPVAPPGYVSVTPPGLFIPVNTLSLSFVDETELYHLAKQHASE
jgi:hypothetical protein